VSWRDATLYWRDEQFCRTGWIARQPVESGFRPFREQISTMLIPVVLSGGAGARLWPVLREAFPKPFIRLPDGSSLL